MIRILNLLVLLLLISFVTTVTITDCSRFAKSRSQIVADDWSNHPSIALSLAQAILRGMGKVMDDLFISEKGFRGMDISIFSNGSEILKAKITDFTRHDKPTPGLFTRWRVYLVSRNNLEYVNTLTFNSIKDNLSTPDSLESEVAADSLFMDIYQSSSKLSLENGSLPSTIKVIYWRNLSKKDRLASLRMYIDLKGKYSANP
ncbi:MAG: hypothetical protein ACE5IW_03100 [bacterium]